MTADETSSAAGSGQQAGEEQDEDPRDYLGRRIAEWVTLGLSILIVTVLAAYLVYHAVREDSRFVPVEIRPLLDQARSEGGRYILPVEIQNNGRRTLVDFTAEITYGGGGAGKQQRQEIKIDFLAERARATRYLYFDADPRGLGVKATPLHYGLQ